jgi:hypothetical protein
VQPIFIYVYINEEVGSHLIKGTTADKPRTLAMHFCKQHNL